MNKTNNETPSFNPYTVDRSAQFWAWHPFGRGIALGILAEVFTSTSFATGLVYGGISGLTNLGTRVVQKQLDIKPESPEIKAVNHLFCATFPWVISAIVMNQTFKKTGKAIFHMSPRAAVGTAFVTELFGYANRDLLFDKESFKYYMDSFSKE